MDAAFSGLVVSDDTAPLSVSQVTPNPCTNLTTSIDGFTADMEENGATVRITNRYEVFCEEHYSKVLS